jgi:hypothetical protein
MNNKIFKNLYPYDASRYFQSIYPSGTLFAFVRRINNYIACPVNLIFSGFPLLHL